MHSLILQHQPEQSVGTHRQLQQSYLAPQSGITCHQAPQSDVSSLQPLQSNGTHSRLTSEALALSDVQRTDMSTPVSTGVFMDSADDTTANKYEFRDEAAEKERLQGVLHYGDGPKSSLPNRNKYSRSGIC